MTSKALIDNEILQDKPHRGSRRTSGSFDIQLMRCGFLPSQSVSSFDVTNLQDLNLDEGDETVEEWDATTTSSSQDASSCLGDQSPSPVKKMTAPASSSIVAAFDLLGTRAAVRRIRRTFSEQACDDITLIKSHHGGTGTSGAEKNFAPAPLRRAKSSVAPGRNYSGWAKKGAMAA